MQSESDPGFLGDMSTMAAQPAQQAPGCHQQQWFFASLDTGTSQRRYHLERDRSAPGNDARQFSAQLETGYAGGPIGRSPIELEMHEDQCPAGAIKHKQADQQMAQQQQYESSERYLQSQATSQNLAKHLIVGPTPPGGPLHNTSPNHMHQVAPYYSNQQQVHQNNYLNQDLTTCSPPDLSLSRQQQQQQQQHYFAGQQQRLNRVVARAQQAGDTLTQLRHRVGSLSVTRREQPSAPSSAVCAARSSFGLSRSLSFSDQLVQGPNQLSHSIKQLQQTLAADDELCCRVSCRVVGQTESDLSVEESDSGSAHQATRYCDIYGNRRQLASGSFSLACSSTIGSPPPMAQAVSPQLMSNQLGLNPRPISSSSSCDGAESYIHLEQQKSALPRYDYHSGQHITQQQAQTQHGLSGANQSRPVTCASSIISASDSLNMSINLEQYISKRNERERSRVRNVNDAFDNLKNSLPLGVEKMSKRMSKIEILRTAIGYIRNLEQILGHQHHQQHQPAGYKHVDIHAKSRVSCNFRRLDSNNHAQLNNNRNRNHHHGHYQIKKYQAHRYQCRLSEDEDWDELKDRREGQQLFSGALANGDLNLSAVEEYERERPQQVDGYQQDKSQADSDLDRVDGNCSLEEDDRFEDY